MSLCKKCRGRIYPMSLSPRGLYPVIPAVGGGAISHGAPWRPRFRGGPEVAGPGGDGGRRGGADRAAAAAGGSGGAGPGPGLAGGPGAAVPRVPGPLRAAELLGGGAAALPRPPTPLHGPDRYRPLPAPIGCRAGPRPHSWQATPLEETTPAMEGHAPLRGHASASSGWAGGRGRGAGSDWEALGRTGEHWAVLRPGWGC